MSYEPAVLALGVLSLLAFERSRSGSRGWWFALISALLLGPWMDWAFGFFVLSLLPLAWTGSLRATLRALLLPWSVAMASLALVFAWLVWAKSAPFLGAHESSGLMRNLLHNSVLAWPPIPVFLAAVGHRLSDAFTSPALAIAAIGLWPAWRIDCRLLLALLVPGLLNVLAFPSHAATHDIYAHYLLPLTAIGVAALWQLMTRRGVPQWVTALAVAGLALHLLVAADWLRYARTLPAQARMGEAATRLAESASEDPEHRPNQVATNVVQMHPYYVHSSRVYLFPLLDSRVLEGVRKGPFRLRYLYIDYRLFSPSAILPPSTTDDPLQHYLASFPRTRLPELEGQWAVGPDLVLIVRTAWVYDL